MNIEYEFEPKITINDYIFNRLNQNINEFATIEQLKEGVEKIIQCVPEQIIKIVEKEDWKLIITNKRDLEKQFGIEYKIFGITNFKEKEILVYAQKDPLKFSIIHEFGHIIDNYLNTISLSEDWKHITDVYAKRAVNHRDNFFTNEIPSEFFSDCVLTYCINKELFGEYNMAEIVSIIERIILILPYVKKEDNISASLTESEKLLKAFNEYNQEYIW